VISKSDSPGDSAGPFILSSRKNTRLIGKKRRKKTPSKQRRCGVRAPRGCAVECHVGGVCQIQAEKEGEWKEWD